METGLGRISSVTENGIDPCCRCRGGMATIRRATFSICARKIALWFYEWKTDA